MSSGISENYRELDALADYDSAWKDSEIPRRQYERVVEGELIKFRAGGKVLPFDVALKCLRMLPRLESPSLLDVGASGGYYSEIIRLGGIAVRYQACDYSASFKALAARLYRGIDFDVADACALPYQDSSFDIVFHGAVIMHVREYRKAIFEAARVAKHYVILHRTPIDKSGTKLFTKDAYDVPCLEIHFDPTELLEIFAQCGLSVIGSIDLFMNENGFGHRSYVLEKDRLVHHQV